MNIENLLLDVLTKVMIKISIHSIMVAFTETVCL